MAKDQSPEDKNNLALQQAEEERDCYRALLHQRTAELEALNKELEALAYSVSHDLRAPLRHINAFTTLLVKEAGPCLSKEAKGFLDIISESAHEMARLLEHLLIFSRLSRAELLPQSVDLNAALQDVINKVTYEHPDRKVIWKNQKLPHVVGDPAMLQQVLTNLVSNALKFTRECKSAEIEIGCREEPSEWVIFVRDNGIGFDMQYADKLFGIFQRLHRTEEYEGVGLGLASVRRIIARHRGRTWAEAKVNEGATFFFSLPKKT